VTAIGPPSRPPRVLFLSGLQIYPPRSGGHLRSFALANALARHGLDVFVYSLAGRKEEYLARRPSGIQAWPGGIPEYVDRKALGFVAQYGSSVLGLPPVWITAYVRAAAASPGEALLPARLRERLVWCDVVVADFPFLHPIFSTPSARDKLHVLSTHNVEHRLLTGPSVGLSRLIRGLVRDLEIRAAQACDILVSCCDGDARFFETSARVRQTVLVPNGIDRRRFQGVEVHRARARRELGIADEVKLVLFTGSKWGPNREAFEYLLSFARTHAQLLAQRGIHILAVGNVAAEPMRLPGFTATGRVDLVEPYFAAADAAINPMLSGAGTNVKMCEFLAMRLPILTTRFGARGFVLEDGRTAFLFEKDGLAPVLSAMRRCFDEDPAGLRRMAEDAYAENEAAIDMDVSARRLREAMSDAGERWREDGQAAVPGLRARPASVQERAWLR
jgi:glycosyltransferase involved in cell wall biosynthesis